jgi:O-antigen/teichoic acid export membrane protein
MRNNIKDFFIYLSSQIIRLGLSIIVSGIWARNTTLEEFGAFQLAISFIALAGIFNFPGLSMAMQLSSAHNKNNNLDLALNRKIKYSFLSSLFLILVGLYFDLTKNNDLVSSLLYISAVFYPLYSLNGLWESWFTGIRKVKRLSLFFILNSLICLLTAYVGLIFIKSIIITVIILLASIGIFNIIILKKFTKEDSGNDKDEKILQYGYTLSGALIIAMLVNLDRFIISEYISLSDVAIYSVAILFASKIKILHATINKLIAPSILKSKTIVQAWSYLKYRLILIWIGFIINGIAGFYFIGDLIVLVFTDRYSDSILYAQWLWLFMSIFRPIIYVANILKAHKIIKFSYYFESINGFGKFLLFLILLPFYQLWGIVYAVLGINIIVLLFTISYFYILYQKELSNEKL